jgi:hypothetical protein
MTSLRLLAAFFSLSLPLVACSSSDGTDGEPASPQTGEPSTSETCSCSITVNGTSKDAQCGRSVCVGGSSFRCTEDAQIVRGGTACATQTPDAGGSNSSPAPSGQALASTVPCSVDSGSCDAATSYCITTGVVRPGGAFTVQAAVCAPFPNGCRSCGCVGDVDATWKRLKNGTANCGVSTLGTAIVSCREATGAITVTCAQR